MTIVKPDLRADAVDQARRLARARALASEREEEALGQFEGDRPWAARARAWRTRSALGSRLVLIYRVAFEDRCGATVESRLIAIAIDLAGSDARREGLRRRTIAQIIRLVEPRIQSELAVAAAGWRRSVEESARPFTSTRAARRRAIVAQAANSRRQAYQAGLFDRRAERAREQDAENVAGEEAATADQLATASLSGAITQRPPQLLLVLTP